MYSLPSESNHTTPNAYVVAHDVGNARVAPEWAPPGHGRLCPLRRFDCCVGRGEITYKIARAEVLYFFPSESNHTTPNASVVTHDVGNARIALEWAPPGHGRLCLLRRFDCCLAAKTPTNHQYSTQPLTPPTPQITPHRTHPLLPMTWITRALPWNGRPPAMGGGRGPGRRRPWCVDDGKNPHMV